MRSDCPLSCVVRRPVSNSPADALDSPTVEQAVEAIEFWRDDQLESLDAPIADQSRVGDTTQLPRCPLLRRAARDRCSIEPTLLRLVTTGSGAEAPGRPSNG